jgi:uncharacterized protein
VTTIAAAPPTAAAFESALYVGRVSHARLRGVRHAFGVGVFFVYLDLDEVDRVFEGRWLWSARRLAPLWFRRADYLGPADVPLAQAVRDAVERRTGHRPDGRIRLLTNLRCLGYAFNPVSFYYCFDRLGRVAAVLAEITNTPWGERHHYVVRADERGELRASFDKQFHVSPFQPMAQRYEWTFAAPGDRLSVHMVNHEGGEPVFSATLVAERRPWTGGNLARVLCRFPCMSLLVIAGIYWHAFRLWLKRAPFYDHPTRQDA